MDPSLSHALSGMQSLALSDTVEDDDWSPVVASLDSVIPASFQMDGDATPARGQFSTTAQCVGQGTAAAGSLLSTVAPVMFMIPGPGTVIGSAMQLTGNLVENFVAPAIYEEISSEDILISMNEQFSSVSMGMSIEEYGTLGDIDEIMTMLHEANFKQDFGGSIRDCQATYSSVTKSLERASNGGSEANLDEAKQMLARKYDDLRLYLEPQGSLGKRTIIEAIKSALKERSTKDALSIFERLMHARASAYAMIQTKLQLEVAEDPEKNQGKLKLLQEKAEDFQVDLQDIKSAVHRRGLPISEF